MKCYQYNVFESHYKHTHTHTLLRWYKEMMKNLWAKQQQQQKCKSLNCKFEIVQIDRMSLELNLFLIRLTTVSPKLYFPNRHDKQSDILESELRKTKRMTSVKTFAN